MDMQGINFPIVHTCAGWIRGFLEQKRKNHISRSGLTDVVRQWGMNIWKTKKDEKGSSFFSFFHQI
jgi:hypothetical protein